MRDEIFEYIIAQGGTTPKIAASICDKMEKHPDIMEEFLFYIRSGEFKQEGAITVEGYSAQQIFESTYLKPTGAFNYLIFLRNNPAQALDQLKKGLPRR